MMELPALLRADGTPMPPFRLSDALAHGPDLNSVVGGHTAHSHHVGSLVVPEARNTLRWTIGVLLLASVIGVVAAIMIARDSSVAVPPAQDPPELAQPASVEPLVRAAKQTTDSTVAAPVPATPTTAEPVPATPATAAPGTTAAPGATDDATDDATATETTGAPTDDKTAAAAGDTTDTTGPEPQVRKPAVVRRRPPVKPFGYLRVQSAPWSEVYVNGQHHPTPGARFELRPGKYRVVLKNGQEPFNTIVKWVTIESNRTSSLSVNMLEDF